MSPAPVETDEQSTTSDNAKAIQVDYYDNRIRFPEFETRRPHGESRFYQFLMEYKIASAAHLLGHPISGRQVLVVCCGSGMEAEYLARRGATVVAVDISQGCLLRARARSSLYEVQYQLVRCDAERLPFADGSFDYVFVHDGLHHLPTPSSAIREMARVSRRAIAIVEPANAAITRTLLRAHLLKPDEEAGNYVTRFDQDDLNRLLVSLGFGEIKSFRYLVRYGHPPASWWRAFDGPVPFWFARHAFMWLGYRVLGRWGNKLTLVAHRSGVSHGAAR